LLWHGHLGTVKRKGRKRISQAYGGDSQLSTLPELPVPLPGKKAVSGGKICDLTIHSVHDIDIAQKAA